MSFLVYSSFKNRLDSGGSVIIPTIKITTTINGTFTLSVRGTVGEKIYIDPGDGSAIEEKVLQSTNVIFTHVYSGGSHTIRITGKIFDITNWLMVNSGVTYFSIPPPGISVGTFDISYNLGLVSNNWMPFVRFYSGVLKGTGVIYLNLEDDSNWKVLSVSGCSNLVSLDTLSNASVGLYSLTASSCTSLRNFDDIKTLSSLTTCNFQSCQLPCSLVDEIYNSLNIAGVSSCVITTDVDCSPPTDSSSAARSDLTGRGCTINKRADCDVITVVGDSLSSNPSPAGVSWPEKMNNATWNNAFIKYKAGGGWYSTYMSSEYDRDTYLFSESPSGYVSYLTIMGGINDIINDVSTEAEIILALGNIIDSAKSDGFTIIAFEILPCTAVTGAKETIRNNVNSYLGTNGNIDYFITVPVLLLDPSNSTYYTGGLHLTDAGAQVLASAVETSLGW